MKKVLVLIMCLFLITSTIALSQERTKYSLRMERKFNKKKYSHKHRSAGKKSKDKRVTTAERFRGPYTVNPRRK